jgi:hypothetical protein
MSLFEQVLGMAHNHPTLQNMAGKLGIDPADAEKALAALVEAHHAPEDTVQAASSKTGLDAGVLNQIVEQIGGEGSLAEFARMLDADHDGNPFDDLAGVAGKLFGKS